MYKRIISIGAILALGLLAGFGVVAGASGAAKPKAKSEVTAQPPDKGRPVHGQVKSVDACEAGRRVRVIEKDDSGMRSVAQTTKTNSRGRYEFEEMWFNISSTYWVDVTPRERKRVICKGDRSPNVYEPAD